MRKNIFIALSACVALAACTKNEVRPVAADQQITFQAVVNKPSTKAMIEVTTFATDSTFGTVAYKVNGSNSELYIPISEVKYNSTDKFWSTEAAYYWPKESGSTLTFYSYCPYYYSEDNTKAPITVTSTKDGLTFTNYSVKDHQKTDLMVAEKKDGMTQNTSDAGGSWAKGVPTVFHHKLAQIFGIKFLTAVDASAESPTIKDYANGHDGTSSKEYVAGDKQFVITGVYFENFYEEGTYTSSDDKWASGSTSTDSYTWYNEASGTKLISGQCSPRSNYYLVLPQKFSSENAKLRVTYEIHTYTSPTEHATEKMNVSIPFKTLHTETGWEKNKKYTYTLKMDLDRIYWDPTVTAWESGSINATI
ncbi:MAG: fimbrillin family protein [Candidatus Cryptobacteroides sp.]